MTLIIGIKETQNNNTAIMLNVIMLSVTFIFCYAEFHGAVIHALNNTAIMLSVI